MKRLLLSIFLVAFAYLRCPAQWRDVKFRGDNAEQVLAFGVHDTSLFVSDVPQNEPLVYRYAPTTPGLWVAANNGIDPTQGNVTSFASLGRYFFAGMLYTPNGSGGPAYATTDNGTNWTKISGVEDIGTAEGYLFSNWASYNGSGLSWYIVRSRNNGQSWDSIADFYAHNFANIGPYVFANTGSSLWRSTDTGNNWFQIHSPIIGKMMPMDSLLFIVGNGQLAKSTDSGTSWSMVMVDSGGVPWPVNCLATDGKNLFAGTTKGMLVSTDTGHTWQARDDGIVDVYRNNSTSVTAIGVFDSLVFSDVTSTYGPDSYYYLYNRPISELTASSGVAEHVPPSDTVEVYPNPATEQVSVLAGGTRVLGVRVLTVLGGTALTQPFPEGEENTVLDLSPLPSGTYFLEIETPEGMIIRKIVKE